MSEVINIVVALAVIVFVFRWATSSKETPAERSARLALGFRPKNVTQEMLDTVQSMFPDMPKDNIRYDLLRTGDVEVTTNKIIERGYLDSPPPAYFRLYPRDQATGAPSTRASSGSSSTTASNAAGPSTPKGPSLIERFSLQERVTDPTASVAPAAPEEAGGKAAWEPTPERREASLRERKAQMVLAARQRLLEQQAKEAARDARALAS